jgi:hypothetical protein
LVRGRCEFAGRAGSGDAAVREVAGKLADETTERRRGGVHGRHCHSIPTSFEGAGGSSETIRRGALGDGWLVRGCTLAQRIASVSRIEAMAAKAGGSPTRAWDQLGRKTQRDVDRRAAKGELHPDPNVRSVSVAWARDLTANKRRLLPKYVAAYVAASLVTAAVLYAFVLVVDWDQGLFGLIFIPLLTGGLTLWAELRTARRIVEIVGEGES